MSSFPLMLTEFKKTLTCISLLKDIIKDTDKEPDEEIYRVRSGSVLSAGASVPMELGCTIFGCVHQSKISLYNILWGFLWGLHHIGVMDY